MRVLVIVRSDPSLPFDLSGALDLNVGDLFWRDAVVSYFMSRGGVARTFSQVQKQLAENNDWARDNFDRVVIPDTCIFSESYKDWLKHLAGLVKTLKLPVYVIGAGIQSFIGEEHEILETCGDEIRAFLAAIYDSGGFLAVRGKTTHQMCLSLGYDCAITGCASLYVGGPNFAVRPKLVDRQSFRLALNGGRVESFPEYLYQDNPNAVFFCQDFYRKLLYRPQLLSRKEMDKLVSARLVKQYANSLSGRVLMFLPNDIKSWMDAFAEYGIAFSYGKRIHGNIIALLSGVPCFVRVGDARVAELVEFYKIPNSKEMAFDEKKDSMYDLYKSLDWTAFNQRYKENYSNFCKVLDTIAPVIDPSNSRFPPADIVGEREFPKVDRSTFLRLSQSLRRRKLASLHFKILGDLFGGEYGARCARRAGRYWK